MAQWTNQFSGNTHSSRVDDRMTILSDAITAWNSVAPENRTPQMRKKLLRLAVDLLAAMIKEKQANLDRSELDKQSESYRSKTVAIEALRERGGDGILRSMGASGW